MNQPPDPSPVLRAKIAGMDCGSCALTIEDGLRKIAGVRRVSVDFTTENLELEGSATLEEVERRLRQLGYRLQHPSGTLDAPRGSASGQSGISAFASFLWGSTQLRVAVIAAALLSVALGLSRTFPALRDDPTVRDGPLLRVTLWAAVIVVGAPIFGKGMRALLFGARVTIELLMTVATLGALLISEAGEAATVILLFTLGEGLERFSAASARQSLRSLLSLQPHTATLLGPDEPAHHGDHGQGDSRDQALAPARAEGHDQVEAHDHDHQPREGHFHASVVAASALKPGDLILVRPGERVAADGWVRSGASSVDQAAVTGESIPVPKGPGDEVVAGSINAEGALQVEVTRTAADSTIARIAKLVEQAQAQRSPVERSIDRFARWYTPAVIAFAVALVACAVLLFHQPFLDVPEGARGWLYRGLTLLIVACPCALVISIPVTVVSSLTRLAHLGVLVKGGEQLDRLASVRTVAFDKTGTLTVGRPSVTAIQARGCAHDEDVTPPCVGCDEVIALAASVEHSSEHPIAHAILHTAAARGLKPVSAAGSITTSAGRGITGELDGARIAVGTHAFLTELGADATVPEFAALRASDRTLMFVARDSKVVGAVGVEDAVRSDSRATLAELRKARPRVRTAMLTGDNQRVASAIAESVGPLDDVRAGLLPADKLAAIKDLRAAHGPVAMVGDGINDTPALAGADIGIAMGAAGSAQAMETADIVLMQDDLRRVPLAMRVARRNRQVVKQNIALSLGMKAAFLALAVPGLATLWLAVAADVGATILVTLNGMRMLRAK